MVTKVSGIDIFLLTRRPLELIPYYNGRNHIYSSTYEEKIIIILIPPQPSLFLSLENSPMHCLSIPHYLGAWNSCRCTSYGLGASLLCRRPFCLLLLLLSWVWSAFGIYLFLFYFWIVMGSVLRLPLDIFASWKCSMFWTSIYDYCSETSDP